MARVGEDQTKRTHAALRTRMSLLKLHLDNCTTEPCKLMQIDESMTPETLETREEASMRDAPMVAKGRNKSSGVHRALPDGVKNVGPRTATVS